ncbi:MAG: hypothetical protein R2771_14355 [Saprospiraceae bacterium]
MMQNIVDINGDVDYFKVNYTESGTVTVNLSSLPANYELELWNETSNLASPSNPGITNETVSIRLQWIRLFLYQSIWKWKYQLSCDNYTLALS